MSNFFQQDGVCLGYDDGDEEDEEKDDDDEDPYRAVLRQDTEIQQLPEAL